MVSHEREGDLLKAQWVAAILIEEVVSEACCHLRQFANLRRYESNAHRRTSKAKAGQETNEPRSRAERKGRCN
jgi:hypothetical protein